MAAIRFRVLPNFRDREEKIKTRRTLNKWLLITLFLLPGMGIFLTFLLMPISQVFYLSLFQWNGLGPMTNFVGTDNYTTLLNNPIFQTAILHSFILMALSLCIQLPMSLGLALMLGRGELRGRRFFRGVLFVPFVFSEIITAIIWLYVIKPENGLLNPVLVTTIPNFTPVSWLADRNIVLFGIFMVITWKYFGFHMILYMAGLQGISKDLEEAARVDGASEATVLRYITLPLLGSTIRLTIFLSVLGSIRTTGEFISAPFAAPQNGIQWTNYIDILLNPSFWNSMKNSLMITVTVTIMNVVLASMLAFVFTRIDFRGRGFVFGVLSLGLLFPIVIAILPIFLQVRQLGLINNIFGVIFPLVAFGLPGSVVILRGFFIHVPNELEDASYIDGCTTFEFFIHILLPLARPALTAVYVLQVIAAWNEYFLPLLVFNDEKLWPLTLGMQQFQGQFGTDWARVMAYVTLLIIPAILFYVVAEKYIVTGLTGGELKG